MKKTGEYSDASSFLLFETRMGMYTISSDANSHELSANVFRRLPFDLHIRCHRALGELK